MEVLNLDFNWPRVFQAGEALPEATLDAGGRFHVLTLSHCRTSTLSAAAEAEAAAWFASQRGLPASDCGFTLRSIDEDSDLERDSVELVRLFATGGRALCRDSGFWESRPVPLPRLHHCPPHHASPPPPPPA